MVFIAELTKTNFQDILGHSLCPFAPWIYGACFDFIFAQEEESRYN